MSRIPYTQTEEYAELRGNRAPERPPAAPRPSAPIVIAPVEIPPGRPSTWTPEQLEAVVRQRCQDLLCAWKSEPSSPPPKSRVPRQRKPRAAQLPADVTGLAQEISPERIFFEPEELGGAIDEPHRTRMAGVEDGFFHCVPQQPGSRDYMLGHHWGRAMRERADQVKAELPAHRARLLRDDVDREHRLPDIRSVFKGWSGFRGVRGSR